MQKTGHVKKLMVGDEFFADHGTRGIDPLLIQKQFTKARAAGVASPATGFTWVRSVGGGPNTTAELMDNEADKKLMVLVHEVGHQYHFNHSELGGRSYWAPGPLDALYQKAKAKGVAISEYAKTEPEEYWAESFTAAVMAPEKLKAVDPEMHKFMASFLKKEGIR